jgi:hypothetical protein
MQATPTRRTAEHPAVRRGGIGVSVPRALLVATAVAFRISGPLIRLGLRNELDNKAFRDALVRLRDAAEVVGCYRGERAETVRLNGLFAGIIANYRRICAAPSPSWDGTRPQLRAVVSYPAVAGDVPDIELGRVMTMVGAPLA